MQYSTNYNLNLVEGTDIVNPLVIDKPNYQTIDAAMKANKDAAVDAATHTKAGTVHAIVRTNTDANVFRFVASAPFTAGDTFTVDGNAVTGINTAGEGLETNDFVIGASVLCVLNSGTLTLNVNKKVIIPATYDASDIVFNNTGTGMSATNAQGALVEINNISCKPSTVTTETRAFPNTGTLNWENRYQFTATKNGAIMAESYFQGQSGKFVALAIDINGSFAAQNGTTLSNADIIAVNSSYKKGDTVTVKGMGDTAITPPDININRFE